MIQAPLGSADLWVQQCGRGLQAEAATAAVLEAVRGELQGATEVLDSMQQMASSSMEGQERAQHQMDALTAQLQAAIQVPTHPSHTCPYC